MEGIAAVGTLVVKFFPPRERGWGDDTEGEVRCMARYGMVVE